MLVRGVAAVAAVAALAVVAAPAPAQTPEIDLDLAIDPTEGPVGTRIGTQVPPEQAQAVCLDAEEALARVQAYLEGVVGDLTGDPALLAAALIAAIQSGTISGPDIDLGLLYVLAFVDLATQQPVPGSETAFWNPLDGSGQITAPDAPRPQLYIVAAVCLGLTDTVSAAALQEALSGIDPADLQAGLEALVFLLVDTENPVGTGIATFCLLGDDGRGCAGDAPPAEPVAATPQFTG